MEIIAKIQTDFPTKFGIPRQSGLVESLKGVITFEPKYRNPQGVYGLDGYSYIWLLWSFSENHREGRRDLAATREWVSLQRDLRFVRMISVFPV